MRRLTLAGLLILGCFTQSATAQTPIQRNVFSGPYLGLYFGGAWTRYDIEFEPFRMNSAVGGGLIGYDWRFGQVVVGVEGTLGGKTGETDDRTGVHIQPGLDGTITGHFGVVLDSPQPVMIYGLVGMGFNNTIINLPSGDSFTDRAASLVWGAACEDGLILVFSEPAESAEA